MQIAITGHHVEVTEGLRNYAEDKLERLKRHYDHVLHVHVILTVEKLIHKAEANVQVDGATLHAEDSQNDMYAALDGLIDKLDRQVKQHKEKHNTHNR